MREKDTDAIRVWSSFSSSFRGSLGLLPEHRGITGEQLNAEEEDDEDEDDFCLFLEKKLRGAIMVPISIAAKISTPDWNQEFGPWSASTDPPTWLAPHQFVPSVIRIGELASLRICHVIRIVVFCGPVKSQVDHFGLFFLRVNMNWAEPSSFSLFWPNKS